MSAFLLAPGTGGDVGAWLLHLATFAGPLALGIFVVHRYGKTR